MITTALLLTLVTSLQSAAKPAPEVTQIAIAPCSDSTSVRTTWLAERRATVRTTTNGQAMPTYAMHDERRIDRSIEVLQCRSGVPMRLRVRYGEAFDKRLDQELDRPDADREPGAPGYTTERSPLAGRVFEIAQIGEAALVYIAEDSPATPSLTGLVLETEAVVGGAVPLPGDSVARALGSEPRQKGAEFEFDALVARSLLAGDETAECAATATFLGNERSAEGRTVARFELRIRVHEEPEGGMLRDADLRGFLLADPRTGRPYSFEVAGDERRLLAASDARNSTEVDVAGTWTVRRTWEWR